jgi:hypothetical protein
LVDIHFSTTAAGQVARRYLGNGRSVKRRHVRIDGRYKPAIEIKRRIAAYSRAIGIAAKNPLIKERVIELAELETLVAELRARILRGEDIGRFATDQIVRFTNSARYMRESLGLNARPDGLEEEYPELTELRKLLEAE